MYITSHSIYKYTYLYMYVCTYVYSYIKKYSKPSQSSLWEHSGTAPAGFTSKLLRVSPKQLTGKACRGCPRMLPEATLRHLSLKRVHDSCSCSGYCSDCCSCCWSSNATRVG